MSGLTPTGSSAGRAFSPYSEFRIGIIPRIALAIGQLALAKFAVAGRTEG